MSISGSSDDGTKTPPSERAPLLVQPPSTTHVPPEALNAPEPSSSGKSGRHARPSISAEDEHAAAKQPFSRARQFLCTVALGFLVFIQATNISMLTNISSDIADALDAFEQSTWFTSSYLIAMSALGPLNGKLALLFGPRNCIFGSAAILAIGCMASSAAASFEMFVLGRCITGIGASGIFTVSIIVVLELSASERRGLAIGLLNSGYTFGVAIGATAAGGLLPYTGWRALFWGQAFIALFAGSVLFLGFPHDFAAGKTVQSDQTVLRRLAKLDYVGALTLTLAITFLLAALSSPNKIPLLPIGLSAVTLLTFVLNEIHLAFDPIVPVTLLKSRGLLLTCLGTLGYMMGRWCVLFYIPTYALAVRQWSSLAAGSILIPTNGGFAFGGLMVGWLHIRRPGSFWGATLVVYSLFPISLALLATLATQQSPAWVFILVVFVCGAVTGAALNYNLAHLLHLTPRSTHYIASSLLATFRGFAGSFGSAIGGGLFIRTLSQSLEDGFDKVGLERQDELIRRLLGSPKLVKHLDGMKQTVAVQSYEDALRTLFLAGAGLAALMVIVQAGTGWHPAEEQSVLAVNDAAVNNDETIEDAPRQDTEGG